MKIDVLKKNQYQNSIWLKMLLQKNLNLIVNKLDVLDGSNWKKSENRYSHTIQTQTYVCIYMYIYVQNDDFKTIKSDSNKVNFLNVSYPKTKVIWYKHPRW